MVRSSFMLVEPGSQNKRTATLQQVTVCRPRFVGNTSDVQAGPLAGNETFSNNPLSLARVTGWSPPWRVKTIALQTDITSSSIVFAAFLPGWICSAVASRPKYCGAPRQSSRDRGLRKKVIKKESQGQRPPGPSAAEFPVPPAHGGALATATPELDHSQPPSRHGRP